MSTEREIAEKFREGVEAKDLNLILPYLAEDVTYELLPSTFVVLLQGGTLRILSAMIQSRGKTYESSVDRSDDRYARYGAGLQGQRTVVERCERN